MAGQIEIKKPERRSAPNIRRVQVAVHLFRIAADFDCAEHPACLSHEERQRAARMTHRQSRAGFVATRIFVRELLGAQLGCLPAEVPIVRDPGGKPRLAGGEIEFSVSHPDGWGAVALSADCPVGVDVEPVRPLAGLAEIVSEFFPWEAEAAYLSAPHQQRQAGFFRCWTRLEAAAKACGRGLDGAPSLEGVVYESYEALPGVAIAVAAPAPGTLAVHWHLP